MTRARLQKPRRRLLAPILAIAAVAGTLTVASSPVLAQSAGSGGDDPNFCYEGWSSTVVPFWDARTIIVIWRCGYDRVALDWFTVPQAPPRIEP